MRMKYCLAGLLVFYRVLAGQPSPARTVTVAVGGQADIVVPINPDISHYPLPKAAPGRLNICMKTCFGEKETALGYDRV
jgi:hypothetical protein